MQCDIPIEELVESFCDTVRPKSVGHGERYLLNESIGSRISSTLSRWNSMKGMMSRADAGSSYLIPCLTERDLRSRRAIHVLRLLA